MKSQIVKIKTIKKLEKNQENRYDLEVEHAHNYFANNILVHNCRAMFTSDSKFISRQGKEFGVLGHLIEEANLIRKFIELSTGQTINLDGELYTNEINFQEIISGIKRDEPNEFTSKIQYHVYDATITDIKYHIRLQALEQAFKNIQPKQLVFVPTHQLSDKTEVNHWHLHYVSNGYEGVMLRNPNGLYTPDKRSYDLQKVKQFNDGEFDIVDYNIDKNGHAVFTCVTEGGALFDVKPKGDNATREEYTELAESLIGKSMTVKYFGMTTGDNPVPRFPVGLKIKNEYE